MTTPLQSDTTVRCVTPKHSCATTPEQIILPAELPDEYPMSVQYSTVFHVHAMDEISSPDQHSTLHQNPTSDQLRTLDRYFTPIRSSTPDQIFRPFYYTSAVQLHKPDNNFIRNELSITDLSLATVNNAMLVHSSITDQNQTRDHNYIASQYSMLDRNFAISQLPKPHPSLIQNLTLDQIPTPVQYCRVVNLHTVDCNLDSDQSSMSVPDKYSVEVQNTTSDQIPTLDESKLPNISEIKNTHITFTETNNITVHCHKPTKCSTSVGSSTPVQSPIATEYSMSRECSSPSRYFTPVQCVIPTQCSVPVRRPLPIWYVNPDQCPAAVDNDNRSTTDVEHANLKKNYSQKALKPFQRLTPNKRSKSFNLPEYDNISKSAQCPSPIHRSTSIRKSLDDIPWLHGKLSLKETEDLFKTKTDGTYLVKESSTHIGHFTLCLYYQKCIKNYLIKRLKNSFTLESSEIEFDNLENLIEYYRHNDQGICTALLNYIPKEYKKPIYLPKSDIMMLKNLRKGQFGKMVIAQWRGQKVLLKKLIYAQEVEVILKRSLWHENLVNLIGIVYKRSHYYLVSTCDYKDCLLDILGSKDNLKLKPEERPKFSYEISSGMEYLERMYVVHKDLAARNIIITESRIAKITNFNMIENMVAPNAFLPFKWSAPEVMRSRCYSSKADMWSFAVLLWELYSHGKKPFSDLSNKNVEKHVRSGRRLKKPEECSGEIYGFMLQAWNLCPDLRPNFRYAKYLFKELM